MIEVELKLAPRFCLSKQYMGTEIEVIPGMPRTPTYAAKMGRAPLGADNGVPGNGMLSLSLGFFTLSSGSR